MSIVQPSLCFGSGVPETYKNGAEALAKCLQDKLLSLCGIGDFVECVNDVNEKSYKCGCGNGQKISGVWKIESGEFSEGFLRLLGNYPSDADDCVEKVRGSMTDKSFCSLYINRWKCTVGSKNFKASGNGLLQSILFKESTFSLENSKSEKEKLTLSYGAENCEEICAVAEESCTASSQESDCSYADGCSCSEKRLFLPRDTQKERLNKDADSIFSDNSTRWSAPDDGISSVVPIPRERIANDPDDVSTDAEKANQTASSSDIKPAESATPTDDLEDDFGVKLRRWSSLKTWKSPPGTPGSKKIVRFADALGLGLADVRTFLDEIPKVPSSAYVDLECDPGNLALQPCTSLTLVPRFQQPGSRADFADRVKSECVCLESATLMDNTVLAVSGCIRVLNLHYEKAVYVRYSSNNWQNYSDLQTTYVANSSDSFSDKFSFILYGRTLDIGQKLEFAVRFECRGAHFWDNNRGENYVFECLAQSPSTSLFTEAPLSPTDAWSIFY